eukprot:m.40711 g.40711  ORF g.40711 m.40711 type:complete len:903 (-) comp9698_c0_seq1:102-2810(-)
MGNKGSKASHDRMHSQYLDTDRPNESYASMKQRAVASWSVAITTKNDVDVMPSRTLAALGRALKGQQAQLKTELSQRQAAVESMEKTLQDLDNNNNNEDNEYAGRHFVNLKDMDKESDNGEQVKKNSWTDGEHPKDRFLRHVKEYYREKLQQELKDAQGQVEKLKTRVEEVEQQYLSQAASLVRMAMPSYLQNSERYRKVFSEAVHAANDSVQKVCSWAEEHGNKQTLITGSDVYVKATQIDNGLHAYFVEDSEDGSYVKARVEDIDGDASQPGSLVKLKIFYEQDMPKHEYEASFSKELTIKRVHVYGGTGVQRQQLPNNTNRKDFAALAALYLRAEMIKPILEKEVSSILAVCRKKGVVEAKVIYAPLKTQDRAAAKVFEKYHGEFDRLCDIARLTIIVQSFSDLFTVLSEMTSHKRKLLKITRVKNRLDPVYDATLSGYYRDLLINVTVPCTSEGDAFEHIAEIQITLASLVDVKRSGGHGGYSVLRNFGLDDASTATHFGGLDTNASLRVASGMLQRLRLDGTQVSVDVLRSEACLGSGFARLTVLSLAGCYGLTACDIGDILTDGVCAKIGGNLEYLDLNGTGITGVIPSYLFSSCKNLKSVNFEGNRLTGELPASVGKANAMEVLNLGNNELSGALPEHICELHKLKRLWVHFNKLTGKIPENIGKIVQLRDFRFFGNEISGTLPKSIGDLNRLLVILGGRNKLTGPIPDEIGKLTGLLDIRLFRNQINGTIPKSIVNLASVEVIDLSNNLLEGEIPEQINKMEKLEVLKLFQNNLFGTIPPSLFGGKRLVGLHLARNSLNGAIPREIGNAKCLETLELHRNLLDGEIPEDVSGLMAIQEINVSNNSLQGQVPVEAFSKLATLHTLRLAKNNFASKKSEIKAELKTALPNTKSIET